MAGVAVAAGIVQLFVLTFVLIFVLTFGAFGRMQMQMKMPIWMSSADDEMAAAVAMAAA